MFSHELNSLLADFPCVVFRSTIVSCHKHPQLFVFPFFKLACLMVRRAPQSQTQCQRETPL